ncbi:putative Protein ROS1 [Corchorus capsularis]|uniref:Uncharacterized protein n=1 Tax=Corchorus capsularis TaxID=210143 RepID=A0A1R3IZM6_COCAP|nr:putative Protein ROS1 [Corchorus capsularis]
MDFNAVKSMSSKEHEPGMESFLAATPTKKNQIEVANLKRTPQKKQRRKKHMPKVITDGKPNKDASTPLGEGNGENSTRKRKCVQRKGLNKDIINITEEECRTGASHLETL